MRSPNLVKPGSGRRWRSLPIVMIVLALGLPLLLTAWIGGSDAWQRVRQFPLGILLLMLTLAALCWNLNAARLRLMLGGRAGALGQRGALGIELASKFALCATPGGSGGAATLLVLLAQRGLPPSKGSAVFLIDQGCDMLFFLSMLGGLVLLSLVGNVHWPHQVLVQSALAGLVIIATLVCLLVYHLPRLLRAQRFRLTWLSRYRRRRLARGFLGFRQALKVTLALPRTTLLAMLALTTVHWLMRYSLLYLAVLGVGGNVDWVWTFLTQMLAMAASQLSFLPGGAGAAEVGVGSLLLPLIAAEQAAAAVLIWRLISYHLYLAAGAPFFLSYGFRLLKPAKLPERQNIGTKKEHP